MNQYIVNVKDGRPDTKEYEIYTPWKGLEDQRHFAYILNTSKEVNWFEIYNQGQKQDKLAVFEKMR